MTRQHICAVHLFAKNFGSSSRLWYLPSGSSPGIEVVPSCTFVLDFRPFLSISKLLVVLSNDYVTYCGICLWYVLMDSPSWCDIYLWFLLLKWDLLSQIYTFTISCVCFVFSHLVLYGHTSSQYVASSKIELLCPTWRNFSVLFVLFCSFSGIHPIATYCWGFITY